MTTIQNAINGINIGGIAAGGATVLTGTVSFANANGVTFGVNGSTVTASVAPSGQTISLSAIGNTTGSTASTTFNTNLSYSGAGGVSVGFSGQTIIISGATTAAQTIQSANIFAVGNTTGSTSSTTFNTNLSFSGGGIASVGLSGNTVIISAPARSMTAVGNTTGSTSSTTFNAINSFSGAGGVSVGFSGQTIIISGATTAAQTIQSANLFAVGNTTGSTSSTTFNTNLSFSGTGIVSVGFSGNTVIISATTSQSVQTEGWTAIGNTTGSTSSTSFNSNFSISGSAGISVGFSGQTIQIAGPATSAQSWFASSNTTGSTSSTTFQNNFTLQGAGGVSVGFSGQSIIISGGAGGGAGTLSVTAVGNTTASTSSTTIAENNVVFSGAGAASLGFSGNTIVVSAASAGNTQSWSAIGQTTGSTNSTTFGPSVSISGAGDVSVGFSGQSIIVSAGHTLSNFYYPINPLYFTAANVAPIASNNLFIQYVPIPQNLSISRAGIYISVSPQTSAAASSGSWSATLAIGLYTRNGTSYSSFLTSSAAISTTWQSNTNSAAVTGVRLATIPLATLLPANEYWIMVNMSTATGGQLSASQSIFNLPATPQSNLSPLDNFGNGAAVASHNYLFGHGTTTTSTFLLPASLGMLTASAGEYGLANFLIQMNNYSIW